MQNNRITLRALVTGSFFAAFFAALAIYVYNHVGILFTATQIGVLPYLLLIAMVLLVNPVLRLVRVVRAFSLVELMIVFIMGMVSAGIPSFGLVDQVLPLAGSLFSGEWNNPQSEWNRYIVPYVNEAYFVSEPGLRQAALDYHQLRGKLMELESAQRAAERILDRRASAAAAAETLRRLETAPDQNQVSREQKLALRRAQLELETLRAEVAAAEQSWSDFTARGHAEMDVVLRDYPGLISGQEQLVEAARLRLENLEAGAFAKVAWFRRGLPRELSAYPGIFPMPQDDWSSYSGRLRRLRDGRAALAAIKEARAIADTDMSRVPALLTRVEEILAPLADVALQEERLELVRIDEEALLAEHAALDGRLKELTARRRQADRGEALALESEVRGLTRDLERLEDRRHDLRMARERCARERDCAANIAALMAAAADLRTGVESPGGMSAGALRARIDDLLPQFASADISLRRYLAGEVPWRLWARPLGRWALLIGLTYVALMSLNVLIFRQWAHNEMITYPLAELPKALVYTARPEGGMPDIFRNGLFWMGAAVSGAVLGWNLLCRSQVVPGLNELVLSNSWSAYVLNTPFQVLMNWRSEVFFTMIGLAFLIPKNISFSLWFFYLAYTVQLLVLYWTGHLDNEGPAQWWYLSNVKYAQGGGALFVFASVVLFKCRHYVLCAFQPSSIKDLAEDERRELRISSWAFIGASVGIILQLWLDMGANLFYTIAFYLLALLVVIAMVRAVVEGGLLAVQTYISPFHILRAFFGLDKPTTAVHLFMPLLLYCGTMFVDLKVFIAPAMANALKLRDDFRMRRGVFHVAVALAIVLAAGVAAVTALMMSYDRGADNMSGWFYTGFPRGTFNTLTTIAKNPPNASASSAIWMSVGAAVTGIIIYLRQFFFWMPHPIGLVVLVSPVMGKYWFSIFLGWLANTAITKYGHKSTYARASGFFIGLIVGELLLVMLSVVVSIVTGTNIGIDLNR